MTQNPDQISLSRDFSVSRERLWRAWTEEAQLKKWFGTRKGSQESAVFQSRLTLSKGGMYHYGMKMGNDAQVWGRFLFEDIQEPERLVFVYSFCDEAGAKEISPPWNKTWPRKILTTLLLEAKGEEKTRLSLMWEPMEASDEEMETFRKNADSMRQGWSGGMEKLAEYLAES